MLSFFQYLNRQCPQRTIKYDNNNKNLRVINWSGSLSIYLFVHVSIRILRFCYCCCMAWWWWWWCIEGNIPSWLNLKIKFGYEFINSFIFNYCKLQMNEWLYAHSGYYIECWKANENGQLNRFKSLIILVGL